MTSSLFGFARSAFADVATKGNLMLGGAAALVLALGVGGGLNEAKPPSVAQLGAASGANHVEAKHLKVDLFPARTTERGIEVPMLIEVTADRSFGGSLDLNKTFQLGEEQAQFSREGKPLTAAKLSPGIPTEVLATWPNTEADTLMVNSMTYRASDLDGSKQWFVSTPAAEVKIR